MNSGHRFAFMLFSVVMPSFLGPYAHAATHREEKFRRAVDSVIGQTYPLWELWIVSDGCDQTMNILQEHYINEARIQASMIAKQPKWHPSVRNVGIANSKGEWIVYLDTDDCWGPDHLKTIVEALTNTTPPSGWAYFNDFAYDTREKQWVERRCQIEKKFAFGTSNFIHRRDLGLYWPKGGYEQDFFFGQMLKKLGEGVRLPTPAYFTMHIPTGAGRYDL